MKLNIGIIGRSEGWKKLLLQAGLSHSIVTDSLLPEEFSVIVVSDNVDDRESEMVRQYIALGGAMLCSAKVYARIRQTTAQSVYIKYLYPMKDSLFHSLGVVDIAARCQLAWNANDLRTNQGNLAAYVGIQADEHVVTLPFDPGSLVLDSRSAVKSFYSPEHRLPFEKVSLVSKGEIRTLVLQCLEILHHRRGLPFVHLWHLPEGARSLFCFRIDTDSGTEEQIKELYLLLHQHGISATWFVDTKSQEKIMKSYSDMCEQEIGVHCFEHQTYPDYENNIQNIRKAQAVLHQAGINAKGFASPFGIWNDQLSRAIADSGFEYSSEFSYDYDNLPSIPWIPNGNGVIQLPVHPICIGSLRGEGYSDDQMIEYFNSVIQRKLAAREPIIIYHHPKNGHHRVLHWLFQEMRRNQVPIKTMGEYLHWWKKRLSSIPKVEYSEGNLFITSAHDEQLLRLHITQPDGTESFMQLSERIILQNIHRELKPQPWSMPEDYLRVQRFNYRIPLVRGLKTVSNFIRSRTTVKE